MLNGLKLLAILLTVFCSFLLRAEEPISLDPIADQHVAFRHSAATLTFYHSKFKERARVDKLIRDLLGPEAPTEVSSTELSSESATTK